MIILAIVAQGEVVGTKGKGKGKTALQHWAIGIDSYNITLLFQSGKNPWGGYKYFMKFHHMAKALEELSLNVSNVSALLTQSINHIFQKPQTGPLSLMQLDKMYDTGKCDTTSSGMKQFCMDIKKQLKQDADDDKGGDIIIDPPDFKGKALPQKMAELVEAEAA